MSKSFLKWAGGKSKLVPFIAQNLPKNGQRLVEPFVGSASVSIQLDFDEYLLNDTNQDLINLYQTLVNEKQEFIDYAQSFFNDINNQESQFYQLREQFNHSTNIVEKSALFVYLNRHAFNGLCRYNRKGQFNVPFGKYKSPYFPKQEMLNFVKKSAKIRFFCGDFSQMFQHLTMNDVVYCDPPYVPLSETALFTSYAKNDFNSDDQIRLANLAKTHYQQTQGILISNHDTKFTRQLYQDAQIKEILVQRNISAKANSRQKVGEILAIYGVDLS